MQKHQATGVGAGWLWLIGLIATLPWIIFFAAGWEMQSPSSKTLVERVRVLESQIKELNQQAGPVATPTGQIAASSASTPTTELTATPAFRLTPVADGRFLVVVVPKGNVRAGPSTNHQIIGAVEAGNTLNPIGRTAERWYQFCCVGGDQFGWVGPVVVEERERNVLTNPDNKPTRVPTKQPEGSRQAPGPPPELGAPPIYTKYLSANGAHILALEDVSSQALKQARNILYGMVEARPELLTAMTAGGLRIMLFDSRTTSLSDLPEFKDWDVAGQHAGGYAFNGSSQAVAAPEQDLRCDGILTHEIGHAVEQVMDKTFGAQLETAYQAAKTKGAWVDPYAATNKHEYWAVAVAYWFHSKAEAARLARIDPEASRLVGSVFGPAQLPTQPCH